MKITNRHFAGKVQALGQHESDFLAKRLCCELPDVSRSLRLWVSEAQKKDSDSGRPGTVLDQVGLGNRGFSPHGPRRRERRTDRPAHLRSPCGFQGGHASAPQSRAHPDTVRAPASLGTVTTRARGLGRWTTFSKAACLSEQ